MNLSSVDVQRRELAFESGASEPFDLLVAVPQHRAPAVARDSGLVGDSGWVEVDRHTLATSAPGVYALGDIAFIRLPSGLPLPKAGVFAHGQAEVVAENVASQIQGRAGTARFDGHGSCFLQVDYRRAAMVSGSFYDEPAPSLQWRRPGMLWQIAKVLFEWRWFQRWL